MIDYLRIAQAISFYAGNGYKIIEMPWIASERALNATLPPGASITKCDLGGLVGSAEQSFIDAALHQKLKGKFLATTPCFRNDIEDELHQKYFMKTELFWNTKEADVHKVINDALRFFRSQEVNPQVLPVEENMWDIVDGVFGIELGSYGIREFEGIKWVYGTGVAEPRLSTVLAKQAKESHV